MSSDPKTVTRFICICIAVLSNCFCFGYVYYQAYYNNQQKKKKIDSKILYFTFLYIIWATITTAYNGLYRFIINADGCRASDTIEEYFVAIGRTYLLLFFTYRVEIAFKLSSFRFNAKYLNIFRVIIIFESLTLNTVWIVDMSVTPVVLGNGLGVYCSNTGRLSLTLPHYIIDLCFNFIVLSMFVDRLIKVTMIAASNERRSTVIDPTENKDKDKEKEKGKEKAGENGRKSGKHNFKNVAKQMNTNNDKLIRVAIRQTILTFISIVSTWIFGLNAIIDLNDELGWFYPLDWGINVLCIVCMFRFVKCRCCTNTCVVCIVLCSGINRGGNDNDNINYNEKDIEMDENDAKFVPVVWIRALKAKSPSFGPLSDPENGSKLASLRRIVSQSSHRDKDNNEHDSNFKD